MLTEALTLQPHWRQRLRRRRHHDTGRRDREGLSGGEDEGEGRTGKEAAGEEARSPCDGEEEGLASFTEREREQMR